MLARGGVMLDDLKKIATVDKSDALGVASKQAQQLLHQFNVPLEFTAEIENVVLDGMGGSAFPGLIVTSWPTIRVPFEISRTYQVPAYVGPNTLYIASSYSGNTEETLTALEQAEQRGANIVVISAGGELMEVAKKRGYPTYEIPHGIQPRMSALYFLNALVDMFEQLHLIDQGSLQELRETADWLNQQHAAWGADIPLSKNPAKQLAEKMLGKTVIVYSGPLLFPAANKWKICINENAKNLAWHNQYPEFDHNEFIGWSSHPVEKPFAVVEIHSVFEHPRVLQRFELSDRLLSGKKPHSYVVEAQGDTLLKQILWAFNFGDFVSIYLAILNNVDPTPVDLVEKLKAELQ